MKTEDMIKKLESKGYKIEKPKKFATVKHSNKIYALLGDEGGDSLIETWNDEDNLNDFEYFEEEKYGHFWINGNVIPVELLINEKWKRFDKVILGRFLNE